MPPSPSFSTTSLRLLQQQLTAAASYMQRMQTENNQGSKISVPETGHIISAAYEQLRNAAEYTEEHLLLQRAIGRFYRRNVSFSSRRSIGNIGEELILELTLAGYLKNNTISMARAAQVQQLVEAHHEMYRALRQAHVPREVSLEWVLQLLPVATEELLNPNGTLIAIAYFAYDHFLQLFSREVFQMTAEENASYELCLYIAVHQALLKSDISIVRHRLLRMYDQSSADMAAFIQFNHNITALFTASLTLQLTRSVSRYGAPIRIIKSMSEEKTIDLPSVLADRNLFLTLYGQQIGKEYARLSKRLNAGIAKSIIFLFITKVLIGLSIEVPFDLLTTGIIATAPLGINLLFPPLYMASLKFGLHTPSQTNAQALADYIDTTLYGELQSLKLSLKMKRRTVNPWVKLLYSVLFLVPFGITVNILFLLHFTVVQAIIFFIFLSTASFLGFRLSRLIRELEIITMKQRPINMIRDFFYLPFILVGQWLSGKYAKVNIVALVLDMMIELPLKTVLRLARQWTHFLRERHEELY